MIGNPVKRGSPSAGLWIGPLAWLVSTQANYSLAAADCESETAIVLMMALGLVSVSLFGGVLSWLGWRAGGGSRPTVPWRDGYPRRFIAAIGVAMAILFALVIALQGAAGMFLSGCER